MLDGARPANTWLPTLLPLNATHALHDIPSKVLSPLTSFCSLLCQVVHRHHPREGGQDTGVVWSSTLVTRPLPMTSRSSTTCMRKPSSEWTLLANMTSTSQNLTWGGAHGAWALPKSTKRPDWIPSPLPFSISTWSPKAGAALDPPPNPGSCCKAFCEFELRTVYESDCLRFALQWTKIMSFCRVRFSFIGKIQVKSMIQKVSVTLCKKCREKEMWECSGKQS